MLTFQQIILKLQSYWDAQGCALLQPYDMEVGAGTSHTATFLRALGPEPWKAAYVQPSRRPKDGRYGENPNRLQHYYQYQVVLKPAPTNILELYLGSLETLGFDLKKNDIRFVEDDWENPTLGAWGLGWEVWLNGMEVTQFTYFQQVGGLDCRPITGEITYGLERLAMYLQGVDNVYNLVWTDTGAAPGRSQADPAPSGGSEPHAVGKPGGDQFSAGPPQGELAPSGGSELHEVNERGGNIWWSNISGGTDFCGAFIGGNRELPQVPGEMQCRLLGCAVEAWNEQGERVIDEVGELVCTQPIPSMPLYFWGDTAKQRYLSSYFDMYPGVWRHGDWLKIGSHGGCVIYGRSDATINRHGLRMGTSEIYSAVEALPEVLDSMVVDLEYLGRESYMPLFVVLRPESTLTPALHAKIVAAIRTALSPRFVPDEIFQVAQIPRTLSGKKQELPIKKLLLGHPLEKVVNREAMANPASLDWYVELARSRQ